MFLIYPRKNPNPNPRPLLPRRVGACWLVLAAAVSAQGVKLAWNPNPENNVAGYILHYGTQSGNLTEFTDVGNKTGTTLEGLPLGVTHYAAVQAYNTLGLMSDLSEEISFVPRIKPPVLVKNPSGLIQPDIGNSLDFGIVRVGALAETRSFTLTNTGTTPLTGLRILLDGATARNFPVSGFPMQPVFARNGSFEEDFSGWSRSGNVRPYEVDPTPAGRKVAQFSAENQPNNGVLSQTFNTIPGTTYQLAFEMGVLSYNLNPQKLRTTLRGQTTLLSNEFSMTGTGDGIVWSSRSLDFTADSAQTTLEFRDVSSFTMNVDLLLDHVRIIDPAPVPAIVGPLVTSLAPGQSATFSVTFRPTSSGARSGWLRVEADHVSVALFESSLGGLGSVQFESWLAEQGLAGAGDETIAPDKPDHSGLNHLQQFAFGIPPKGPAGGAVAAANGQLVARGTPAARVLTGTAFEFQGLFGRRKDHAMLNLRYIPQFSADLIHWVDATAMPVAIGDDGEIEVVSVTSPDLIGGKPARFFRVGVDTAVARSFQQWLADHAADGGAFGNPDGDALNNLMEFAFGTDPKVAQSRSAAEKSGLIAARGAPSVRVFGSTGAPDFEFNGLFCRRKDRATTRLTYRPQFSPDLITWQDATASPETIADDGEIEVVAVRAPASIGGKAPRFFRVGVEHQP
jgi:hypothetical protein